jgi:3-dehydroquinate dehydratase-2
MPSPILILNGPNLNLLGEREPEIYGTETLADIEAAAKAAGGELDLNVELRQTNSEAELVTWIQEARGKYAGIVLNAGAFTHTSVAIYDALLLCDQPVIEVHLSNIFRREPFRHHSYVAPAAQGLICGFGGHGYVLALQAMAGILDQDAKSKK